MSKKKNNSGQRGHKEQQPTSWYQGKEPIFKFVGLFALLMVVFYVCTFIPLLEKRILPSYMKLNASVSAGILSVFGERASAKGTSVSSPRYSVDIRHGCDAVEPTALFVAAVLAFPATMRSKMPVTIAFIHIPNAYNCMGLSSLRIATRCNQTRNATNRLTSRNPQIAHRHRLLQRNGVANINASVKIVGL